MQLNASFWMPARGTRYDHLLPKYQKGVDDPPYLRPHPPLDQTTNLPYGNGNDLDVHGYV